MPILFLVLGIGVVAVLASRKASEKPEEQKGEGEKPPAPGYTVTLAPSSITPMSRAPSASEYAATLAQTSNTRAPLSRKAWPEPDSICAYAIDKMPPELRALVLKAGESAGTTELRHMAAVLNDPFYDNKYNFVVQCLRTRADEVARS